MSATVPTPSPPKRPPSEHQAVPQALGVDSSSNTGRRQTGRHKAVLVLTSLLSVGAIALATPTISSAAQADRPSIGSELYVDQRPHLHQELDLGPDVQWHHEEADNGTEVDTDWDDTDWDDIDWDDTDWDNDWIDPFQGMTDEDIDDLSDEEFFAILDDADIGDWAESESPMESDGEDSGWSDDDWDDDWIDPFQGMTDEEVDALSDEEFFALLDTDWDDTDWDDTDWDDTDWDDQWGDEDAPVATFTVVDGNLVGSGASAEQIEQATAIWERFGQLIPASERSMLSGFELMSPEYGGAHVYADEADPTKWIMGVDTALAGSELDYVLIHEFGHLLTLKASEVPPGFGAGTCDTYHPGEGCALSQSTLATFVAAFWPQSLQDQLEQINQSGDWEALDSYYAQNADSFVSDYALTNPVEDLAETFAEFVLNERPSGSTIADQKVNLLWADQEMVSLRDKIRSQLR